jgi:hypothetical protein
VVHRVVGFRDPVERPWREVELALGVAAPACREQQRSP